MHNTHNTVQRKVMWENSDPFYFSTIHMSDLLLPFYSHNKSQESKHTHTSYVWGSYTRNGTKHYFLTCLNSSKHYIMICQMRLEIWKTKFVSCVTCMCVNLTNRISSLCNTSENAGNGEYEKNGEYDFHFFSGTTT